MKNDWITELYVKERIQNTEKRVTEIYLDENGNTVFTEHYLKKRSACCGNGCKHCPFEPKHLKGNNKLRDIY